MVKSLNVSRGTERYSDLSDYAKRSGKRKGFIARFELGITPAKFSELLNPETYRPRVSDELIQRIAKLLNQKPQDVRKLYESAA